MITGVTLAPESLRGRLRRAAGDEVALAHQGEDGQRANAELAEDEARFIDLERSSLFLTEEQVMFDSGG